ncbi:MAG: molybdenum cofactor guanylyltransferase, partial [Armatimonadetes bacterium]|nr:molybdenum cofactor guanylyltransferase [Armatimonadota bacterium]
MPLTTAAALLCGGLSERLNYPKEMLRVDGAPLAVPLARRLREVFASVSVVSNHPDYLRYCFDGPILSDEFRHQGPLAGLHAGLHAGLKRALPQSGAGRCFFLACDMPLVHNGLVRRILERSERSSAPAVVASANGCLEPLCGVYSTELVPALERHLSSPGSESRSVRDFLAEVGFETVEFTGEEAALLRDLDKPEDLFILNKVFRDVEPLPVSLVSLST